MKTFNKLVRDEIPDLIRAEGRTPRVRTLDDLEFETELMRKLDEELIELRESRSLEEIADLLEVLRALAGLWGFNESDVANELNRKRMKSGGFLKRTFLIGSD